MSRQVVERLTLDFVSRLDTIDTPDAVTDLFQNYVQQIGFNFAICLKVPEAGEDLSSCFLMNSYPVDWVQHYAANNYIRVDPIVKELFKTYHPYTWSEATSRGDFAPRAGTMLNEAREFGMHEGFAVPIYEASGYTGIVSLAGSNPVAYEDQRNAMTLACIYLHNKLSTLRRRAASEALELTDRELECLRWAAVGKSDWEIGQILNISAKTVNYHIENAKRKFGVATRIQAIVAALRRGKLMH